EKQHIQRGSEGESKPGGVMKSSLPLLKKGRGIVRRVQLQIFLVAVHRPEEGKPGGNQGSEAKNVAQQMHGLHWPALQARLFDLRLQTVQVNQSERDIRSDPVILLTDKFY